MVVDGYIRIYSKDIIIPYDINKICFDFYCDVFHWTFDVPEKNTYITPPLTNFDQVLNDADSVSHDIEVMDIKMN